MRVALGAFVPLFAVVVPGSASLLDRDLERRADSTPIEAPAGSQTEPDRSIVLEAVEGSIRDLTVSILDRPRTDRDALAGWAAAQVSASVAESARLAITYDDRQRRRGGLCIRRRPDTRRLRVEGSTRRPVSAEGPNVAIAPSKSGFHTYSLQSRGEQTVTFSTNDDSHTC